MPKKGLGTLSSAASGQDIQEHEGDHDDRRRDSDNGDGGGGYDHTAVLPHCSVLKLGDLDS